MSAYVQFFIRGGDNFYPIASYSRNNELYRSFGSYVPYGQIKALDASVLDCIRANVKADKNIINDIINSMKDDIELVLKLDAPISDKMEQIHTIKSWIKENEDSIKELDSVLYFTYFLDDMINEAECEGIAPHEYVYAGIEVGSPTIDDIEE